MKKPLLTRTLGLLCAVAFIVPVSAQVTMNDSIPVDDLIMDFFNSGVMVSVSNVTVNGQPAADMVHPQFGLFNNGLSDSLGMNSGLAMYTDNVSVLANQWNSELFLEFHYDPDMAAMAGANVIHCAVVEFDVLVDADALAFNYVFGSNEYANFTCSMYNDAFGLFISGPGIEGPYSNGAINIATIPDSDIPVSINTVNSGSASGSFDPANCEAANPNWQQDTVYFVDNTDYAASSAYVLGYTVPLEAYVEVEFGQTYHMKFAVCDVTDGAFDSGVLLEEGSFEGRLINDVQDRERTSFTLYPNPARDVVELRDLGFEARTATLIDITGRRVKTIPLRASPNPTLSISDLETGVYLVEIGDAAGRRATSKLVVR